MLRVELPAALGLTEKNPVGSAVGSAVEAMAFNEGFHEDGGVAVDALPVLRQSFMNAAPMALLRRAWRG